MPVGPSMGASLESPDNPESAGVARPSSLVGGEDQPSGEGSMPGPNRQLTQVLGRMRQIETQLEKIAMSYPRAGGALRKVKDLLRQASGKIAATGGPGQEPASPRMLG